jgi:repressor LexA
VGVITTPAPKQLTERQQEILDFINRFTNTYRRSPTIREICSGCGYNSTKSARDVLKAIEAKGYTTHEPGIPRSIKVIKLDKANLETLVEDPRRPDFK